MRRSKKRYSHVKALLVETKHENVNMDALYDFMIILHSLCKKIFHNSRRLLLKEKVMLKIIISLFF